jgi:hypothetical protein
VIAEMEAWAQLVLLMGKYRRAERRDSEVARDAAEIRRAAERLASLAEADCNRGLSAREEAKEGRLREQIAALVAEGYDGMTARFGGDPRGYVVALVCRDGEHNSWGGAESGWGVA